MKLSFPWLWWIWFVGLIYDVVISVVGFFPSRALAERLDEDAHIAWFIFSVWIVVWMVNRGWLSSTKQTRTPPDFSGA